MEDIRQELGTIIAEHMARQQEITLRQDTAIANRVLHRRRFGGLALPEEYYAFHGVGDESKVQIADFHTTGSALSWIRGLRRNKLLTTWSRFVEDLCERFRTAEFEN